MTANDVIQYDPENRMLTCAGAWDVSNLPHIKSTLDKIKWPDSGELTVNGGGITKLDSAGAWLLYTWQEKVKSAGVKAHLVKFSDNAHTLIQIVASHLKQNPEVPERKELGFVTKLGVITTDMFYAFMQYLSFVGMLTYELLRIFVNPKRLRLNSYASVIFNAGYSALPIIALLSFMIGVVITYQMGLQLKNYGANVYIVDLLGVAILREFGPLLTAIMVAGRSGSAFTAQLGIMKINQEVDALDTMGVTPSELLLIPRILGLLIALPLLTMWANIMGVFGGMFMSNNMLGISWYDFLERFPEVIPLKSLLIGLGKTPIFALLIASIGCQQGMLVGSSADSVGKNTTRSVVLAIFFIIVADAIFSIIFSKLKL